MPLTADLLAGLAEGRSEVLARLPNVWGPLIICGLSLPLSPRVFCKEFLGMVTIILGACGAAPLAAHSGVPETAVFISTLIIADTSFFGPSINTSFSMVDYMLGKQPWANVHASMAAHIAGGLVGWPLLVFLMNLLGRSSEVSGPSWTNGSVASLEEALMHEFVATFLLVIWLKFLLHTPYLKRRYLVRMVLLGGMDSRTCGRPRSVPMFALIRILGKVFKASGPAINPTVATTYAFFKTSQVTSDHLPTWAAFLENSHIWIYWAASILGAIAAVPVVWLVGFDHFSPKKAADKASDKSGKKD